MMTVQDWFEIAKSEFEKHAVHMKYHVTKSRIEDALYISVNIIESPNTSFDVTPAGYRHKGKVTTDITDIFASLLKWRFGTKRQLKRIGCETCNAS